MEYVLKTPDFRLLVTQFVITHHKPGGWHTDGTYAIPEMEVLYNSTEHVSQQDGNQQAVKQEMHEEGWGLGQPSQKLLVHSRR